MQTQRLAVRGTGLAAARPSPRRSRVVAQIRAAEVQERFRLNNIGPAPGSRREETRKGRGYGAGQGGTCGYGMRGQNSRSGPSTRPGFEGGQTALYRRLPKLKGIAGGMSAGRPKSVVINLEDLAAKFSEGDVVTLDALKEKNLINASGRERNFGLKVLGEGELPFALTVKAELFSEAAKEKIAKAGGSVELVPVKEVWTRKAHERKMREAAKSGKSQKSAQATSAKKK